MPRFRILPDSLSPTRAAFGTSPFPHAWAPLRHGPGVPPFHQTLSSVPGTHTGLACHLTPTQALPPSLPAFGFPRTSVLQLPRAG